MSKSNTYLFDATKGQIKDFIAKLVLNRPVLGIDPGEKRLGLAVSDSSLMIATPLFTLTKKSFAKDIAKIIEIIKERNICAIVCGFPLQMNGEIGKSAENAIKFALKVIEETNLPMLLWDERFSTSAVEKFLIKEADLSRKKRSKVIDRAAAAYILQGALDTIKNNLSQIK